MKVNINLTASVVILSIIIIASGLFDARIVSKKNESKDPINVSQLKTGSHMGWEFTAPSQITSVDITENGSYIAIGTYNSDNKIYLFNKSSNVPIWFNQFSESVKSVAISSDGTYVAASTNSRSYLFNLTNLVDPLLWSYNIGGNIAISSNGSLIALGNFGFNSVYLFNNTYSMSKTPLWSKNLGKGIQFISISSDGFYITAAGISKVFTFNRTSSDLMWSYTFSGNLEIQSIEICLDGRYIVTNTFTTADNHGEITVFNTSDDQNPFLWEYVNNYNILEVSISSSGTYIAAVFGNPSTSTEELFLFKKISIWNILWHSNLDDGILTTVSISSNGNYMATGGSDYAATGGRVYMFHLSKNDPLWDIDVGSIQFQSNNDCFKISSNGNYLASANVNELFLINNTDTQIPLDLGGSSSNGGGDSSDDATIPIGNFFLIFIIITIISIVIFTKPKIKFKLI